MMTLLRVLGLFWLLSAITGSRADTYEVRVTVAGVPTGIWDQQEGGKVDSSETKFKPGGLGEEISLGGTKTTEMLTLRRLYSYPRDHAKSQRWINWVGKADVTVSKQPLDEDGNAWGRPLVYTGKLKSVSFPNHDSNSQDAGLIEIEVTASAITGMAA